MRSSGVSLRHDCSSSVGAPRAPEEPRPALSGTLIRLRAPMSADPSAHRRGTSVIRHREVDRQGSASSPEGPGYNYWYLLHYSRAARQIKMIRRQPPKATVRPTAARRTLAPRCIKDLIEERLFASRRNLFSELSVVFTDTATLFFEGRGGDTLGQRGHTKDYRPHLNQMVVGIIMDQNGRPVCSEMWPGNTTDVTTLLPVIDRLRQRFAIGRVCVVADRGMISDATIAGLEERKLEYILGVRERNSKEVYEVVLNDQKPSVPLVIPRGQRRDTELEAKNVWVGDRRYVVCRNLAEAKRDAEVRARGGDKALVGNSAYRRYLKTPDDKHFEIDDKRVAEDARYDGLYVLRTNMRLDALGVMLRYRELLKVEDIFRTTKSILDTRPIYHQTDEAIRGHVFCSFLALVLRKALEDRLAAARLKPEWGALLRELDRLQEIETEQEGKHFVLRTPVTGDVGRVFQALGIALPPNIREAGAAAPVH